MSSVESVPDYRLIQLAAMDADGPQKFFYSHRVMNNNNNNDPKGRGGKSTTGGGSQKNGGKGRGGKGRGRGGVVVVKKGPAPSEKKQNRYNKQQGYKVDDDDQKKGPNVQVRKNGEKKIERSNPKFSTFDQIRKDREEQAAKRKQKVGKFKIPNKPPYCIRFGNLPFKATEEEFRQWLPANYAVDEIRWKEGTCFVDFKNREDVEEVLKLDGFKFRTRIVRLSIAKPMRRAAPKFKEHMKVEEAKKLIDEGVLCCGNLRVNPHNRKEAYATITGFTFDVKFKSLAAQNRALDGDLVAIRIKDKKDWIEMEKEEVVGEDEVISEGSSEEDEDEEVETGETEPVKLSSLEKEQKEATDGNLRPTGEVVALLERCAMTKYVGWLRSCNEKEELSEKSDYAFFIPFHKKMHRMLVPLNKLPATWRVKEKLETHLYGCELEDWKVSQSSPMGRLVKDYGKGGDLEVEKTILLDANNIDFDDSFSVEVNACLPPKDFKITDEEIARRRDLRNLLICSIDPATAKDLDDALSIERLENGNWSVGVHIADVTHFVKPGTALDDEARSRATSVYLVDQCIPMLPRILSERLCSLNSGQDCLAFSAIFEMTKDGEVVSEWFGKSCIRNAMQMSYEVAQSIIDGEDQEGDFKIDPATKHTRKDVQEAVLALHQLSRVMRKKRFERAGSVQLSSVKLVFDLEEGTGKPVSVRHYKQKPANELVEEFMLLANRRVAMFCLSKFPEGTLLRKHEKPGLKMKEFVALCSKFGYKVDASSSFSLNASLAAIEDPQKPHVQQVIYYLALRAMQLAKYTQTEVEFPKETYFWHYALAFDIYTHFTSPIRRFADVAVHRILNAALTKDSQPMAKQELKEIANQCNERKVLADRASDRSDVVFLCHLLKDKPAEEVEGYVFRVTSKGFDVMCPKYGIEDGIMLDRIGLVKESNFVEDKMVLSCTFDSYNSEYFLEQNIDEEKDKRPLAITVTMFQKVRLICKIKDNKRELDMGLRLIITDQGI